MGAKNEDVKKRVKKNYNNNNNIYSDFINTEILHLTVKSSAVARESIFDFHNRQMLYYSVF